VPGCDPAQPVPVVAFHGVADEWVAFGGGLGPDVYGLGGAATHELINVAAPTESGLSVPGVAAAWAARNGCGPRATEQALEPDVTLVRYECPSHADVQLYEVAGGGHTWPGSRLSKALVSFVGSTTFTINADAIMWKFFQQHPLRGEG
jgi:polyhydroxybutyrate depolymerase